MVIVFADMQGFNALVPRPIMQADVIERGIHRLTAEGLARTQRLQLGEINNGRFSILHQTTAPLAVKNLFAFGIHTVNVVLHRRVARRDHTDVHRQRVLP